MSKYKYYFRRTRSDIAKDILKLLLAAGMIYIAAGSPYFISSLLKKERKFKKYKERKIYDTFYNFKKQGLINIEKEGYDVRISLTKKGRQRAGWMQIDELKVAKTKSWDRKWRVVIFDIPHFKRLQRNAFRTKIKELGFRHLQKSVWVCPYECADEISLLRDFFGLTGKEICLITAVEIENGPSLQKLFKICKMAAS